MHHIVDNFLSKKEFEKIQNIMWIHHTTALPWFYCEGIVDNTDGKFQFVHGFYNNGIPCSSFLKNLHPMINKMKMVTLVRVKANLLTITPKIVVNDFHVDMADVLEKRLKQLTTSIFYVNTNDGYTEFEDGTKVESVANRMLTFPSNMKHTGTTCTDENTRVVINFNYFAQ